jgi:hypothetical protein
MTARQRNVAGLQQPPRDMGRARGRWCQVHSHIEEEDNYNPYEVGRWRKNRPPRHRLYRAARAQPHPARAAPLHPDLAHFFPPRPRRTVQTTTT